MTPADSFDSTYERPSRFLVEHIDLLPKGRVLDVAMGAGRNGIYLAQLGFEVEGVDISANAVDKALEKAALQGLSLKASVVDLEGDYQIEKDAYDLIVCFHYLQRRLIPQIKDGLKVGGMVVYETYTIDQPRFGKPRNPEYLLMHNELLDMFGDFRCLRYHEGIYANRKAVAGIISEKTRS